MVLEIIKLSKEDFYDPNNVLRQKSGAVLVFDSEFQEELNNLIETFEKGRGVGLAAPQLGIFKRFAIINPDKKENPNHLIIVNPEIVSLTGSKKAQKEACLSLPGYKGNVIRKTKLRLKYQDRFGVEHEEVFTDFQARVIQHEFDHLDGILFVDRMPSEDALEEVVAENATTTTPS